MWIHTEITYGFYMPDEYEELKRFEANADTSQARRSEDSIAVRYKYKYDYVGEYRPKGEDND